MALTTIADRLTPSVPIEITYGAQPIAAGAKVATLIGHVAEDNATTDFTVHEIINVGDAVAAQAEVDAIAGEGSEAGKMAYAFVASNSLAGRFNFPAFRVVLMPHAETAFGSNSVVNYLLGSERSDLIVSPYPASNGSALDFIYSLAKGLSGPDRDLNGQFGTTGVIASMDDSATALAAVINKRELVIPYLPDTSAQKSQSEGVLAAAVASAMLSLGQPYRPAQGLVLGGIVKPAKRADWIQVDPFGLSEAALAKGYSPMTIQADGSVGILRTRLSLILKPDGVTAVTDYIDWQQLQKLYDYREALYQASQNPPFAGNPGGALASADIAKKFSDEMLRIAMDFEKAGMFQNVKQLAKFFVCEQSKTTRGRLDARVPVDAVPGLNVLAINLLAVSDAANFTI